MTDQNLSDAQKLLAAAFVLERRAQEQGKTTFVTAVFIKVLRNTARKWMAQ